MLNASIEPEGQAADFTLPKGCPLCGGELVVRLTPGAGHSYCATCHWISRSHIAVGPDSVRVEHPPGGLA